MLQTPKYREIKEVEIKSHLYHKFNLKEPKANHNAILHVKKIKCTQYVDIWSVFK